MVAAHATPLASSTANAIEASNKIVFFISRPPFFDSAGA
jgi:hypothetical protein